jgi:hypothetical protein
MSAALSFFSGCSFALSGLALLPLSVLIKERQRLSYIFSRRFTHICYVSLVPTLTFRIYGGSSIAATPFFAPRNNNFRYHNYNFLRCLGCLIADSKETS